MHLFWYTVVSSQCMRMPRFDTKHRQGNMYRPIYTQSTVKPNILPTGQHLQEERSHIVRDACPAGSSNERRMCRFISFQPAKPFICPTPLLVEDGSNYNHIGCCMLVDTSWLVDTPLSKQVCASNITQNHVQTHVRYIRKYRNQPHHEGNRHYVIPPRVPRFPWMRWAQLVWNAAHRGWFLLITFKTAGRRLPQTHHNVPSYLINLFEVKWT